MTPPRGAALRRRVFLAVFVGSLLLELAWVLALPAFRGADEFDHAYKADAVAHGELRAVSDAPSGRGGLVPVGPELVAAAGPVCSSYLYTRPDNCRSAGTTADGRALVASAAESYDPVFYAVVGTAARPFDGVAALVVMRLATAVLTSLLLGAAAAVTAGWSRTGWPLLALAVACTPVLVQSGAVAAPNAVGYAGAALVWAAGLGLVQRDGPPTWGWLTLGSVTVLVTHTTGLMWLLLVLLAVLLLRPRTWWSSRLRAERGPAAGAALTVAACAAGCLAWIRYADTNALSGPTDQPPLELPMLAVQQFLWAMQTIAAFPTRNEPAPSWVYTCWLAVLAVLWGYGALVARRRVRVVAGLVLAAWFAVPLALTFVSYSSQGYAWQGRYALPLAIGLPALAGLALERRGTAPARPLVATVLALVAIAHVSSVVAVTLDERRADFPGTFVLAVPGGLAVVALLAVAGVAVAALPARRGRAVPAPRAGAVLRPEVRA